MFNSLTIVFKFALFNILPLPSLLKRVESAGQPESTMQENQLGCSVTTPCQTPEPRVSQSTLVYRVHVVTHHMLNIGSNKPSTCKAFKNELRPHLKISCTFIFLNGLSVLSSSIFGNEVIPTI